MAPGNNDPRELFPHLSPEVVARLLTFVERTSDLVGVTDDQGRVVYLNEAARRRLGVRLDGPEPLTTADVFTEDSFETYFEEVRPAILRGETWSGEVKARTSTGDTIDVWVTVVGDTGPGAEVTWLVTSARDITPWLAEQAELHRRATHDELTDLAGRGVLFEHIELALHRAQRTGGLAAVLFIDVNDLKAVNDIFGHHAGDELLVEVARRLQRAVRTIDTVARVGGDEFVVLLDGIAAESHAATLATRIQAAVETVPVHAGDEEVNVSLSIGIAVSAGDADPETLIRRADAAMYEVKHERRRVPGIVGAPGHGDAIRAVHEVAVAVTQRAVRPWYQPVVRLDGGGAGGVEGFQVLARWVLPGGMVLPAADFVPDIEGTGVAFSADLAVLREATRVVAALDRTPPPGIWALLSSRSLRTRGAEHFIHQALAHADLHPGRLALEVAADLVVSSDARVAGTLSDLRGLGARLVVNVTDPVHLELFERTGHTPPVDEVRLGRAFVVVLREAPADVAALIARGHRQGRRFHLCGIESAEDLARAAEAGVDLVTGYHLGIPDRQPRPTA